MAAYFFLLRLSFFRPADLHDLKLESATNLVRAPCSLRDFVLQKVIVEATPHRKLIAESTQRDSFKQRVTQL